MNNARPDLQVVPEGGAMERWQDLAELWVRGRVRRRDIVPATGRNHRSALTKFVRVVGNRTTIRRHDVERWQEEVAHLKASTRRSDYAAVRGFCRWLVDEGHLTKDPTFGIRGPKEPRRIPRYLDPDQIAEILAACPDLRSEVMVWLGFGCGMRVAEMHGVEIGDWDRHARTIRVTGKGAHEREVPVPALVAVALARYLTQHPATVGPLIRSYRTGGALTADTIGGILSEIMRAAGVKLSARDGVSAHALRHSCASDTLEASEGNLWLVAELLGHANLNTVRVYLRHARTPEMRTAMDHRLWPHAA